MRCKLWTVLASNICIANRGPLSGEWYCVSCRDQRSGALEKARREIRALQEAHGQMKHERDSMVGQNQLKVNSTKGSAVTLHLGKDNYTKDSTMLTALQASLDRESDLEKKLKEQNRKVTLLQKKVDRSDAAQNAETDILRRSLSTSEKRVETCQRQMVSLTEQMTVLQKRHGVNKQVVEE